ncbi:MAG TPA: hypothetical protein VHM88_09570 [Candidatus Acidoferrales bacterium]|nr:hypothetical protein [Candidatus Acidoferrales bacterium]
MFRFRDRIGVLDERSQHFLKTVAWLGGYVTPEQAQELGIRNSVTRVHVQLKDLEAWRFINPVSAYPTIYQITKSVTRLLGADLSARREHTLETIRTRLLTVNFYLEAIRWPVKFVLDHRQKISKLFEVVAEPALLPYRGNKPYLWQDLVLQRPSGEVVLAMVDHFGRHASRQLYRHLKRFAPSLGPDDLRLMIVVSSEHREQLFRRQLNHARLQRLLEQQGIDLPPKDMVTIYRVRRAVPVVRPVITNRQQLRELRARKLANQGLSGAQQQTRHVIHNSGTHTNTAVSNEEGGNSW